MSQLHSAQISLGYDRNMHTKKEIFVRQNDPLRHGLCPPLIWLWFLFSLSRLCALLESRMCPCVILNQSHTFPRRLLESDGVGHVCRGIVSKWEACPSAVITLWHFTQWRLWINTRHFGPLSPIDIYFSFPASLAFYLILSFSLTYCPSFLQRFHVWQFPSETHTHRWLWQHGVP